MVYPPCMMKLHSLEKSPLFLIKKKSRGKHNAKQYAPLKLGKIHIR